MSVDLSLIQFSLQKNAKISYLFARQNPGMTLDQRHTAIRMLIGGASVGEGC